MGKTFKRRIHAIHYTVQKQGQERQSPCLEVVFPRTRVRDVPAGEREYVVCGAEGIIYTNSPSKILR